jgi:hypothetical protein
MDIPIRGKNYKVGTEKITLTLIRADRTHDSSGSDQILVTFIIYLFCV